MQDIQGLVTNGDGLEADVVAGPGQIQEFVEGGVQRDGIVHEYFRKVEREWLAGEASDGPEVFPATPRAGGGMIQPGAFAPAALVDLLRSRRSCRSFRPEPVPVPFLEDLVRAAVTAPSGTNSQRWTFTLLAGRPAVEKLGAAVADFFRRLNRMSATAAGVVALTTPAEAAPVRVSPASRQTVNKKDPHRAWAPSMANPRGDTRGQPPSTTSTSGTRTAEARTNRTREAKYSGSPATSSRPTATDPPTNTMIEFRRIFGVTRALLERGQAAGVLRPAEPIFVHLTLVGTLVVYCLSEPLRQRFAAAARDLGFAADLPVDEAAAFLAGIVGRGLAVAPQTEEAHRETA